MPESKDQRVEYRIKMGVGDAIKRLTHIEFLYRQGLAPVPDDALKERDLIITSLNQFELHLNLDCDAEGAPDSAALFQESTVTSCCRLLPLGKIPADGSRLALPPDKKKRGSTTSRLTVPGTEAEPEAEPVVEVEGIIIEGPPPLPGGAKELGRDGKE
jgi:hypothetical protein